MIRTPSSAESVSYSWEPFQVWRRSDIDRVAVVPAMELANEVPRSFENLFHRQGRFYYTAAIHQSPARLVRGLAWFLKPKRIACLNPETILRFTLVRRGLLAVTLLAMLALVGSSIRLTREPGLLGVPARQ